MEELLKQHPQIFVYVVGLGSVLLLLSARLPIFSDNIGKFFASLRRTAQKRDDADIRELKRQVTNLEARSKSRDEEDNARRELLEKHAQWDRDVYRGMMILLAERHPDSETEIEITFPPPLF